MEILETFKPGETVIEEGTKGTSSFGAERLGSFCP